jgi:hypothetical protein
MLIEFGVMYEIDIRIQQVQFDLLEWCNTIIPLMGSTVLCTAQFGLRLIQSYLRLSRVSSSGIWYSSEPPLWKPQILHTFK